MQAYSKVFARFYNQEWGSYAKGVSPKLLNFYKQTKVSSQNNKVLDLCCGTGNLAQLFLEDGFQVTGIDLSDDMLYFAKEKNIAFLEKGQANFIVGNAADFVLDDKFGLVVSTYDSINHLEDEEGLLSCFTCVYSVLINGGLFIFDINTIAALSNWNWHSITIIDREDLMLVTRGIFDAKLGKAMYKCSGFLKANDSFYERFEQTIVNTAFSTLKIKQILEDVGWKHVYFATPDDLFKSIDDPEKIDQENGVLIIAQK